MSLPILSTNETTCITWPLISLVTWTRIQGPTRQRSEGVKGITLRRNKLWPAVPGQDCRLLALQCLQNSNFSAKEKTGSLVHRQWEQRHEHFSQPFYPPAFLLHTTPNAQSGRAAWPPMALGGWWGGCEKVEVLRGKRYFIPPNSPFPACLCSRLRHKLTKLPRTQRLDLQDAERYWNTVKLRAG